MHHLRSETSKANSKLEAELAAETKAARKAEARYVKEKRYLPWCPVPRLGARVVVQLKLWFGHDREEGPA
jgi:hypothetical protein